MTINPDVPGWLIARAARSIHVSGEGDECDGRDELWCSACWDEAVAWTDPDTTSPGLLEVDAEYARLSVNEGLRPPEVSDE